MKQIKQHTRVKLLIKNVANPRKPCMTNPARMHLISEMPEPAAYFAKERTKWDAMNENKAYHGWLEVCPSYNKSQLCKRGKRTANVTKIIHRAKVTWLQECHESHPSTSSPSISQQQNCWFNHQPSKQYPIFMSDNHWVIMEMTAALAPMHTPVIE